jgi:hypothetical protein
MYSNILKQGSKTGNANVRLARGLTPLATDEQREEKEISTPLFIISHVFIIGITV